MIASNIMPLDSIVVEIVHDRQASLVLSLADFSIVWLWFACASSVTPVSISFAVGWSNFGPASRPEPSVDQIGVKIGTMGASSEITLPPTRPNIANGATGNPLLDEIVLLWSFQTHKVHAMTSANVPSVQPINL